jgi:hypothetical protein
MEVDLSFMIKISTTMKPEIKKQNKTKQNTKPNPKHSGLLILRQRKISQDSFLIQFEFPK